MHIKVAKTEKERLSQYFDYHENINTLINTSLVRNFGHDVLV